jgi:hypothetical protein
VAFNSRTLHHAGASVNFSEKRKAFAILYADDALALRHRPPLLPPVARDHGPRLA